jgi:SAM-dependent methyltransferase
MTLDWGLGHYEQTARELEPAARHVLELADPHGGERLLDLACGTGNAALIAARAGADVIGLDAAPRLIAVARGRASAEQLDVTFVVEDMQQLPFDDGAFDVVVSVFGIIFATDAERASAEMMRVLAIGGRALVSAWVPEGPIDAMIGVMARAIGEATGQRPQRFPWHDPDTVGRLAALRGVQIQTHEAALAFVAASPEEYFALGEANHPMSLAGRSVLERAGAYAAAREQAMAILREANEDRDRFRVTSPYRVLELRRAER